VPQLTNLFVGFNNQDSVFSGQIRRWNDGVPNAIHLYKVGAGTMSITGTQDNLAASSGNVLVFQGALAYSGGGTALMPNHLVYKNGTLLIDNSVTNTNNRLASPLTSVANSTLNITGGTVTVLGNAGTNTTEGVTTLTIGSGGGGAGILNLDANDATNVTFNVGTLSGLSTGGTLLLRGDLSAVGEGAVAGRANLFVTNYTVTAGQTTNSGGNVLTNGQHLMMIRPDILGDYSMTGLGTAFVTRDSVTGYLRPLAENEMRPTLTNQSYTNVSLSSNGVIGSGDQAINSLRLLEGGGLSTNSVAAYGRWNVNGGILTEHVRTGGVLAFEGNGGITTPGLATYSGWMYFHTIGENTTLNISSTLWNFGSGIVKSGEGTLILGSKNYYGSNTIVNEGRLVLAGQDNSLVVGTNFNTTTHTAAYYNLYMNGGVLDLNGGSQMFGTFATANQLPFGGEVTNSASNQVTLRVNTGSAVFGGTITGNLNFVKSGNSDWSSATATPTPARRSSMATPSPCVTTAPSPAPPASR